MPKFLTDIITNYKVDTMDVSSLTKRWHSFTTIGASSTVRPSLDGTLYVVVPGVTVTFVGDHMVYGDTIRFVRTNVPGDAEITTSDSWVNGTACSLSVGQFVDFIWTPAGWISAGNFTM